MHSIHRLVLVLLTCASSTDAAQRLGPQKKAAPSQETAAAPGRARLPVAGLRGAPSGSEENEAGESDPAFDFGKGLKRSAGTPGGATASGASSPDGRAAALRLAEHPRRSELARWLEDALRGKEIDVALLGGHKYMLNDCLGIKASAGQFRLKLENPSVRFENTGLVLAFAIDRVSLSALKIRMRPNTNPLELCKFGKKFEVGGAMDDVRLTLRFDPLYDPERCRIGSWGDANPEVRIGNLNLKPLQNDLDRMAKNMVEDALTFALQVTVDGMLSALGDLLFSAVDQFLEADCPTQPGETGRATTRVAGALGGAATGGAGSPPGAGSAAPSSGGEARAAADVQALLARVAELEARIAELEAGVPPAADLESLLRQAIERLGTLDARAAGPELRGLLARFLALALERSALGDPRAAMDELTRLVVAPRSPPPAPAGAAAPPASTSWTLVPNPELEGRMGRIVVRFPDAKLASGTHVQLDRNGKKVADLYGEATWDLLPGVHDVLVTRARVAGCEVRTGHDTLVRTGMLVIELGSGTLVRVFQKGVEQKLCDGYGSLTIGLPIGDYEVEIHGQREPVTVREGEITRF